MPADESKAAADEAFISSLNERIVAASRDEADRPVAGQSPGSSTSSSTTSFDEVGDDELANALSAASQRFAGLGEDAMPTMTPVSPLSGALELGRLSLPDHTQPERASKAQGVACSVVAESLLGAFECNTTRCLVNHFLKLPHKALQS